MVSQTLKRIALYVGVPIALYFTTKNWGFDVKSFGHVEDERFISAYEYAKKAGRENDRIEGGANIEGMLFGRDEELGGLTVAISKFPYSRSTLEQKTLYYNNLLGDRRFMVGDVDSGRYLFTVADEDKNVKFARIFDVKGGNDYFVDLEMKRGLKSLVQRFHTGVAKLWHRFGNYLVERKYGVQKQEGQPAEDEVQAKN